MRSIHQFGVILLAYITNLILCQFNLFGMTIATSVPPHQNTAKQMGVGGTVNVNVNDFLLTRNVTGHLVVSEDLDLKGETLSLAKDESIEFSGGRIMNGVIVGNESTILANDEDKIFRSVVLKGTWTNSRFSIKWFGANGSYVKRWWDKKEDIEDVLAFRSAVETANNLGNFALFMPKGVYWSESQCYTLQSSHNPWTTGETTIFSIEGAGEQTVIVFPENSDGISLNNSSSFGRYFFSGFRLCRAGKPKSYFFGSHRSPSDYIKNEGSFIGEQAGLGIHGGGYSSCISRVFIYGFRLGLAITENYGGPIVENCFIDNCGVGCFNKKNTTITYISDSFNGYESGFSAFECAGSLTNVICEGNLRYFIDDAKGKKYANYIIDSQSYPNKFQGNGFSFYNSTFFMTRCYTEKLFGNSRFLYLSKVKEVASSIDNHNWDISILQEDNIVRKYLQEHDRDKADLYFVIDTYAPQLTSYSYEFGNAPFYQYLNHKVVSFENLSNKVAKAFYHSTIDGCLYLKDINISVHTTHQGAIKAIRMYEQEGYKYNVSFGKESLDNNTSDVKYVGTKRIMLEPEGDNHFLPSNSVGVERRVLSNQDDSIYNLFGIDITSTSDGKFQLLGREGNVVGGKEVENNKKTIAIVNPSKGTVQFNGLVLDCLSIGDINRLKNVQDGYMVYSSDLKKYIISYNGIWYDANGIVTIGSTQMRPYIKNVGFKFYDLSVNCVIIWDGSTWVKQ